MPIICLLGPDGSDKTTIINGLIEELRTGSLKVKLSWIREPTC